MGEGPQWLTDLCTTRRGENVAFFFYAAILHVLPWDGEKILLFYNSFHVILQILPQGGEKCLQPLI